MSSRIILSGPMGNGIRPKKYFETTKELMRKTKIKSVTVQPNEFGFPKKPQNTTTP